ncbi:MAG: hypothetical protein ACRDMX_13100 [Solirubrobacteraceae bacterium]
MIDDPIVLLERELVGAARRRAAVAPAHRRSAAAAVALSAAAAIAVAVVAAALVGLGGHATPGTVGQRGVVRPGGGTSTTLDRRLLTILGVMRRPQTVLDRRILRQSGLPNGPVTPLTGTVVASSARLATIAPWGSHVLLALVNAPTPAQLAHLPRAFRHAAHAGLTLWVDHGGGGGADTASMVQAGKEWSLDGAGRSFAGGSTAARFYVVVPDGVARVAFYLPARRVSASGPTYSHGLTVTAQVHDNIAAVEIHRDVCCAPPLMTWYAADGRVIKRIGRRRPVSPAS